MRSSSRWVAWVLLALLPGGASCSTPETAGEPTSAPLEISFLANEGVLLRGGGKAVVIDGFVAEPYSIYGHLPADDVRRLEAGEVPFDEVRLALVSHRHRDHVQPPVAAAWLAARPERLLAAAPQVLDDLRAVGGDLDSRTREEWPAPGETSVVEVDGVRVSAFRLSHGSERHAAIQNLGHVVRIAGVDVLHVGDAEMRITNFEPFAELLAEVDVAILPYWYWDDERGRSLIARFFSEVPKIAVHVPHGELEAVEARLAARDPDVVVFRATHDLRRFLASTATAR